MAGDLSQFEPGFLDPVFGSSPGYGDIDLQDGSSSHARHAHHAQHAKPRRAKSPRRPRIFAVFEEDTAKPPRGLEHSLNTLRKHARHSFDREEEAGLQV